MCISSACHFGLCWTIKVNFTLYDLDQTLPDSRLPGGGSVPVKLTSENISTSHGDKESLKYPALSQPLYHWQQHFNPLPRTPTLEGICGCLINTNRNKAWRLCPHFFAVCFLCHYHSVMQYEEAEYTTWGWDTIRKPFHGPFGVAGGSGQCCPGASPPPSLLLLIHTHSALFWQLTRHVTNSSLFLKEISYRTTLLVMKDFRWLIHMEVDNYCAAL